MAALCHKEQGSVELGDLIARFMRWYASLLITWHCWLLVCFVAQVNNNRDDENLIVRICLGSDWLSWALFCILLCVFLFYSFVCFAFVCWRPFRLMCWFSVAIDKKRRSFCVVLHTAWAIKTAFSQGFLSLHNRSHNAWLEGNSLNLYNGCTVHLREMWIELHSPWGKSSRPFIAWFTKRLLWKSMNALIFILSSAEDFWWLTWSVKQFTLFYVADPKQVLVQEDIWCGLKGQKR